MRSTSDTTTPPSRCKYGTAAVRPLGRHDASANVGNGIEQPRASKYLLTLGRLLYIRHSVYQIWPFLRLQCPNSISGGDSSQTPPNASRPT